jgi:hypothetical protein
MDYTLSLIHGVSQNEKLLMKINRSLLFLILPVIFLFLLTISVRHWILTSLIIALIIPILILSIIKIHVKYRKMGNIFFSEDSVFFNIDEKEFTFTYDEIKKIIFIFESPQDPINSKFLVFPSGYDNQLVIHANESYEFNIYCENETYEQIKQFVRNNKSKCEFIIN